VQHYQFDLFRKKKNTPTTFLELSYAYLDTKRIQQEQKERSYPESNRGRPDVLHHRSNVDQNRK
jgi:hypothetical protein